MKESKDIPRSQLVSMIADLRGITYETRMYFVAKEAGREYMTKEELVKEVDAAILRTRFDLSEEDEVEGGYDPTHRKEA